jgi:DNA-binding beta-propeller fold protein YncE
VWRALTPVVLSVVAAGCGSGAPLPPAAEPARSPAPAREPAGRVVDLGERATGVTVDELTGVVAVAVDHEIALVDGTTLEVVRRVRRHAAADRLVPPPLGTATLDDGTEAVVDPERRRLRVGDEEVPAGLGPTDVDAGDGGRLYVSDTDGGSVLLVRTRPDLALVRRAALPGQPYATAVDREKGKLWVTVTARNQAVQLTADGAPRVQRRVATVRQPDAIAVDGRRGRVYVAGAAGELQAFDASPPRLPAR